MTPDPMRDDEAPALAAFDLDSFTPYRLAVAAKRTSEELARQYRKRFGISIPEWRILAHLADAQDGLSVRDLKARVALEKYEISRTASRLAEKGLIAKTPHATDGRLVSLCLTGKGHALMEDLLPLARAYQARIEARLGAAMKGLDDGLEKLLRETE